MDEYTIISTKRSPLASGSLAEWTPNITNSTSLSALYRRTEADALTCCSALVQDGHEVKVITPQNVHWEHAEVMRRLTPTEPYTA